MNEDRGRERDAHSRRVSRTGTLMLWVRSSSCAVLCASQWVKVKERLLSAISRSPSAEDPTALANVAIRQNFVGAASGASSSN